MKIENNKIKELVNKWDVSGGVAVYHNSECMYRDFSGLANRETNELINEESTYLLSGTSQFLIDFSLLLLEDMKLLELSDTLDKYLPEYIHAGKIKISHLILGESGLRDFFYGNIMPKLKIDEKHNLLDERTRLIKEKTLSMYSYSFKEVLDIIGEQELEYEPGEEKDGYSTTDLIFCKEIIERVSGMKLLDFEIKYIFDQLNMTQTKKGNYANTKNYCSYRHSELLHIPTDEINTDLLTTTFCDMEKLLIALCDGKLLSQKTWKKALTFNEENRGLGFSMVNGTVSCSELGFGNTVSIYFNREAKLCYMHLSNSESITKNINGSWMFFRKELRSEIDALFTYPKNTRIVLYNKKNWYDTLNLEISEEQYEFVCDAKQSIAFAFAYKSDQKLFVCMEGDKPVGLMVLQANKKKQDFHVSILLVDRRYQGRGFGKILLKWGVEYLKKQGAKELSIGVNRFNISAQNLYKSVGFREDLVYEEGILMKMNLK